MYKNAVKVHPVIMVGAGISGLATAWRLTRSGIRPTIVDGAPRIAEPWRRRHPALRLNTHRHFSHLPGLAPPRDGGAFLPRNTVIRYVEEYERRLRLSVQYGVNVDRIERDGGLWRLHTNAGPRHARHVVVATGRERVPVLPDWPGAPDFTGSLMHAADFGDARACENRRVLVVGAGNSGVDVLNHLARVRTRSLWVSVRNGTVVIPTRLGGFPVQRLSGVTSLLPTRLADRMLAMTERIAFGNLRRHGLARHPEGASTRLARHGIAPAIDDGFIGALKAGRILVVPAVARFRDDTAILTDGTALEPDIVICATGYSPGLEDVVGHLGVLDRRGIPRFQGAEADRALPGLWFIGMRPRLQGNFYAARKDSRQLAARISRRLSTDRTGDSPKYAGTGTGPAGA